MKYMNNSMFMRTEDMEKRPRIEICYDKRDNLYGKMRIRLSELEEGEDGKLYIKRSFIREMEENNSHVIDNFNSYLAKIYNYMRRNRDRGCALTILYDGMPIYRIPL